MTNKIIAVKLRNIGDTVFWTAALTSLKTVYPDARIDVLTYASNQHVLKHHPAVSQIRVLASSSRWELIKVLWSLRKEKYDWFLGFNCRKALCRFAKLSGAKKFVLQHYSLKKKALFFFANF